MGYRHLCDKVFACAAILYNSFVFFKIGYIIFFYGFSCTNLLCTQYVQNSPILVQLGALVHCLIGKWVYYLKDLLTNVLYALCTALLIAAYVLTHKAAWLLINPLLYMPSIFTIALTVYILKDFYNYFIELSGNAAPPNIDDMRHRESFDTNCARSTILFFATFALLMDLMILYLGCTCSSNECIWLVKSPQSIQICTLIHCLTGKWVYYLKDKVTKLVYALCSVLLIPAYIVSHILAWPLINHIHLVPSIITLALMAYVSKDSYYYIVELNKNIPPPDVEDD